jgi:hypothetical protein
MLAALLVSSTVEYSLSSFSSNFLNQVSKMSSMTLGLARMIAPNFGQIGTHTKPDGTIELKKLSGLKGIGHAGLTS